MSLNPKEYEKFLGHTFVLRQNQIAFAVGEKVWTRWEMANVFGLANFRAAGTLTLHLRKMNIKTLEQLYALDPAELACIKGIGETGAYVAASILKEHSFDTKRWAGYSLAPGASPVVTFRTLKNRSARRRNGARRQKHARA